MRVEKIGDATLYLGDCLEILPTLGKVDAVITDPPYGIDNDCNYDRFPKGGQVYKQIEGDSKEFDPTPLLKFSPLIIWGGNNFANKLPPAGWLVWQKTMLPNPYYSDGEIAWRSNSRGIRIFRYDQMPPNQSPRNGNRDAVHPTQKPVALMQWCIEFCDGETILDPFMGSGTTGVACANLGRKFIGIEISEKYFNIAVERITNAYRQRPLFDHAETNNPRPSQLSVLPEDI